MPRDRALIMISFVDNEQQLLTELKQVSDPEILHTFAGHLLNEIKALKADNDRLRKAIDEQAAKRQMVLEDKLLSLRKIIFGKSSEKRNHVSGRPRDKEEQDVLFASQCLVPPPKENEIKKLEEERRVHQMTDGELKEEADIRELPNDWEKIDGLFEESREVTVIERQYKQVLHQRQKYRHKSSTKDNQIIVTAKGTEKLLPGCQYSVDFAVDVVSDKYQDHLPLERIRRRMERHGLSVPVKTLYNLSLAVGVHLDRVVLEILTEILTSNLAVHADESPWPVQDKKDDDGYMWVVSNQAGSIYRFEPTRSGKVIEEILKQYKGPVLSDGFSGYNALKRLPEITLANCWAHARRKFTDIEPNYPAPCKEILDLIDELFACEHGPRTFEELEKVRREKSGPLIDKIKDWLVVKKSEARSESGLMKAIDYSLKYWPGLTAFLTDARIPLSNNDAERAIRHAVMGRKNFYGSKTINGADTAATLYSVIESCKRVLLDPKDYIRMAVLRSIRKEPVITPLQYAKQTRSV